MESNSHKLSTISQFAQQASSEDESALRERRLESDQRIKERETERRGREEYFNLRSEWSARLAWFLGVMILFQILLTLVIGAGWLDFASYETFLYLVVGENFVQIVGMCILVVQFLFPKNTD